jgi:hypothetical protein
MRLAHGYDAKSMVVFDGRDPYDRAMLQSALQETRTLTLVLPEAEWRALRDAEPDALGWLQRQIRNRLSAVELPQPESTSKASTYSTEDEY